MTPEEIAKRKEQLAHPVVPKVIKVMAKAQVKVFRLTNGRIGSKWRIGAGFRKPVPTLLLDHVGRKSGTTFTTPLLYLADGPNVVVVASQGGLPKHPQWFHNLVAEPGHLGAREEAGAATDAGSGRRRRRASRAVAPPGRAVRRLRGLPGSGRPRDPRCGAGAALRDNRPMADQDPTPREEHPVLTGLIALVGVALVVGLILGGGALAATKVLGLDDDGTGTDEAVVR